MARTKTLLSNARTEAQATAALEQALNPVEGREQAWTVDQIKRHASAPVLKLVAKLAKPLPAPKAPKAAPKAKAKAPKPAPKAKRAPRRK